MRASILSLIAAAALVSIANAQSPVPVVVPAMTPATTVTSGATVDSSAGATQSALKTLQTLKAANDEILKQQAATLQKLDELEKAANEIRIYTKRS